MSANTDIYRIQLQQGMFARVAKAIGVGRSHVSRVANGERRSPRVEKALRAELQRINRLVEKRSKQSVTATRVAA